MQFPRRYLRTSGFCADIGANVEYYSLLMARQAANIHTFKCLPGNTKTSCQPGPQSFRRGCWRGRACCGPTVVWNGVVPLKTNQVIINSINLKVFIHACEAKYI